MARWVAVIVSIRPDEFHTGCISVPSCYHGVICCAHNLLQCLTCLECFYVFYRPLMQDTRDLPSRLPRSLWRSLLLLRISLQYDDEDILYHCDGPNHLPDEVQGTILHDLWLSRRSVPSLQGPHPSRSCSHLRSQHWMDSLDLCLVFLAMVGGDRLHPPDRHAP